VRKLESGAYQLSLLWKHEHPSRIPELVKTLRVLTKNNKLCDKLLKAHKAYVDRLHRQMAGISHFAEKRVQDAPLVIGVRYIREDTKCGLREAVWMYKYLTKGIRPWFEDQYYETRR